MYVCLYEDICPNKVIYTLRETSPWSLQTYTFKTMLGSHSKWAVIWRRLQEDLKTRNYMLNVVAFIKCMLSHFGMEYQAAINGLIFVLWFTLYRRQLLILRWNGYVTFKYRTGFFLPNVYVCIHIQPSLELACMLVFEWVNAITAQKCGLKKNTCITYLLIEIDCQLNVYFIPFLSNLI